MNIGSDGAKSIGEGLKYFKNVTNLTLIIELNNNIRSTGAIAIGEGIK